MFENIPLLPLPLPLPVLVHHNHPVFLLLHLPPPPFPAPLLGQFVCFNLSLYSLSSEHIMTCGMNIIKTREAKRTYKRVQSHDTLQLQTPGFHRGANCTGQSPTVFQAKRWHVSLSLRCTPRIVADQKKVSSENNWLNP